MNQATEPMHVIRSQDKIAYHKSRIALLKLAKSDPLVALPLLRSMDRSAFRMGIYF